MLEVPTWQDQASIRASAWSWLRYRPAAAARYAACVQRVAHLILFHLLEPSWHSWTSAWLQMPLFYYAIIPDELHWLLDLAVRLSCWLVFRLQKQSAPEKRVSLAPGVYTAVPRTQSKGSGLLPIFQSILSTCACIQLKFPAYMPYCLQIIYLHHSLHIGTSSLSLLDCSTRSKGYMYCRQVCARKPQALRATSRPTHRKSCCNPIAGLIG